MDEIDELKNLYQAKTSKLAVLYERRRIGKSSLVEYFSSDLPHLKLEGIEGTHTSEQLKQVALDLRQQIKDPFLPSLQFNHWNAVFDYLTHYISSSQQKIITLTFGADACLSETNSGAARHRESWRQVFNLHW